MKEGTGKKKGGCISVIFSIIVLMVIISMMFSCGKDKETNTKSSGQKKEVSTDETSEKKDEQEKQRLEGLAGKTLTEAIPEFDGYTLTYMDGTADLTEILDPADTFTTDMYTVKELSVNTHDKTATLTIQSEADKAAEKMESALNEKLEEATAWVAANRYGKEEYGEGFDLNYILGKINASPKDENTWFLKAECDLNGVEMTCEALVTGTTESPQVTELIVY